MNIFGAPMDIMKIDKEIDFPEKERS